MFLHWLHKALFTSYLYIYFFFEKEKENKNEIE